MVLVRRKHLPADVQDLLGAIIVTSYGTGPYRVVDICRTHFRWSDEDGDPGWSLTMELEDDPGAKRAGHYWINWVRFDGDEIRAGKETITVLRRDTEPQQFGLF